MADRCFAGGCYAKITNKSIEATAIHPQRIPEENSFEDSVIKLGMRIDRTLSESTHPRNFTTQSQKVFKSIVIVNDRLPFVEKKVL